MPKQGRLSDKAKIPADAHGCPACPHTCIGPAMSGSPDVVVNGRPMLRITDNGIHAACCGPNMWVATGGSGTVVVNGLKAHRKDDQTTHCGGMGKLNEGSDDVDTGG